MIILDGTEGGGQILRTALSLSAISGKPFTLKHIRGARPNPGLQAQHLTAVHAAQQVCQAQVTGASLGSEELSFIPG
ncbi:MAG: RNA 3'-terminal phosphate cyclase, partial [Nanoarchaeota archaeon]|nr:RNA 3'-terminal phosphate cyclase [Nanoarchaeota archaeon]